MRLVQMNGVDLRTFQFDYDQTWAVFFLNADGTVYGRYGTRADRGQNSTSHVSAAALKKAMGRALALHRGYPGNRVRLAGKLGPEPEFRYPQQIPNLTDRPARVVTAGGHACIHCHEVRENTVRYLWEKRRLTPAEVYAYPLPETVGLKMETEDCLRVAAVTPGSPAARAGLQPGDALESLAGQPLISQADIQWVLYRSRDGARLPVTYLRDGRSASKILDLGAGWRESDISWRASSGPGFRWGLWSVPLSGEEKRQHGIAPDAMALRVRNLFAPRAGAVQRAGVRVGDILVALDGKTHFRTEGAFLAYLRLTHPPGSRMKLALLRGGERVEIDLEAW